jgi:aminoglycoside phosphotransferase (APT) family kinase protein
VHLNEVAAEIGVVLVGRPRHGANAGAYAVRTADGTDAVLKIVTDAPEESALVAALRTRGYPIPAVMRSGTIGDVAYELTELVDGAPVDQPAIEQLRAVEDLIARQRDIGLGSGDWIEHMVTSVTAGCSGYCEHAAMRSHSEATRALLERLRRLADARRDVDVRTVDAVHYDFSPYNVLVRGDDVTGVVDWDGARLGDAAFDLVTLAFYTYDIEVRDALVAAAGARTSAPALELYAAHMVLRQVDWSLRHHESAEAEWFMGIGETLLGRLAT